MNKITLLILGILLALSVISACQYTQIESYQELELGLYDSSQNYVGSPLQFSDFSGGAFNLNGCNPPSFRIYNPLNLDITLNITFVTNWEGVLNSYPINQQTTTSINKNSRSDLIMGSCPDIGGGSISQEDMKYIIFSPEMIGLQNLNVNKNRTICKICTNGEECLDDGASCVEVSEKSLECGSGICNTLNKCGQTFNFGCPEGQEFDNTLKKCKNTAKTEVGIWVGNNVWWMIILVIIVIIVIILKKKKIISRAKETGQIIIDNAKNKAKEIEKTAKNNLENIQSEQEEWAKIKRRIANEKLTTEELAHLKKEQEKLKQDIENNWAEITKPHPDKFANGRLVVINPYLGGYKCFYHP